MIQMCCYADVRFEPAGTTGQAEAWAIEHKLAGVVDYEGLPVWVANVWNHAVLATLKEFPALRKRLRFVGTIQAA